MSSMVNHRKRSRRGHYMASAYSGGRRSNIKPSISKTPYMGLIKMLRRARERTKTSRDSTAEVSL